MVSRDKWTEVTGGLAGSDVFKCPCQGGPSKKHDTALAKRLCDCLCDEDGCTESMIRDCDRGELVRCLEYVAVWFADHVKNLEIESRFKNRDHLKDEIGKLVAACAKPTNPGSRDPLRDLVEITRWLCANTLAIVLSRKIL